MSDREAEWEEVYDREAGDGRAKLRAYIERHRGSRDQIVVHTYFNIDKDPSEQDHDIWRFWLIDEENQIAKYKTTRGESEPSDLALFALQEYGWDCENFQMQTEEEFESDEADAYKQLAREMLRRAGSLDDPAREDLMVEAFVRLELYSKLTDPEGGGTELLDVIYGENDESTNADITLTIPEFVPPDERASLSNAIVDRFQELAAEYSDSAWQMNDERTIR